METSSTSKKQFILQIRQLSGDKTEATQPLEISAVKPLVDPDSSPQSHASFTDVFKINQIQPIDPRSKFFGSAFVKDELISINNNNNNNNLQNKSQSPQIITHSDQETIGQFEAKFDELGDHKDSVDFIRQTKHLGTLEMRDFTQFKFNDAQRNTLLIDLKNEEEESRQQYAPQNTEYIKEQDQDGDCENEDGGKQKTRANSTKSSLNSSSSSIQLEDYFRQDGDKRKEEQMRHVITDITKFKSYFVKFRFEFFFEFMIIHFLFFAMLGPLANPIIYKFGKGLPRNLMFWGNHYIFFYQTLFYVLFLVAIALYATYRTNFVYFQSEVVYLCLGIFYRIFTISVKYATFDPVKIKAIKDHTFEPQELQSDFFLGDWRVQKDRIIFEEIYFAQRVYDIDTSWMYIEFMLSPEKETIDKINENNQLLSAFHKQTDIPFQPTPITTTLPSNQPYYAYGIIKYLVDQFQKLHSFEINHAKLAARIYAIIRAIIPTIYKIAEHKEEFFTQQEWYEWVISISIIFQAYHFYFYVTWTLIQGVIDMKRKIFLMEQMAFMISPRKLRTIDIDKVLPTINIFKSCNLKAWQLMRHVCQEYGKRYDIRVQSNFSGLVLIMVISIVVVILDYSSVISLEPSFLVILILETICALFIVMKVLFYGAKINSQFDLHDSILNQNKGVVMDIYRMRRRYFCQQFKTQNYLYAKAVTKIKEDVQLLNLENPCAHIKEIVDSYDTHIDELKFDKQQNPFRIGSLTITNGMLESGIIGIASIIIAIIAKYLSYRLGN